MADLLARTGASFLTAATHTLGAGLLVGRAVASVIGRPREGRGAVRDESSARCTSPG
jgi:hypothetical protein